MHKTLGLACVCVALISTPLAAQQLAYGGAPAVSSGYSSYVNKPGPSIDNIVFDNFAVPDGSIWNVTGVFGNIGFSGLDQNPTRMYWQVRSGMSIGSGGGGTLLHSGSGAFTGSLPLLSLDVNAFALGSGEYWLGLYFDLASPIVVEPDFNKLTSLRITSTSANAQNWPDDNNALWLIGEEGGANPQSVIAIPYDFSIGLMGTSSTVVPEPESLALLVAGMAGMAWRRSRASA